MEKNKSGKAINKDDVKKIKVVKAQKKDSAVLEEEKRLKAEKKAAAKRRSENKSKNNAEVKIFASDVPKTEVLQELNQIENFSDIKEKAEVLQEESSNQKESSNTAVKKNRILFLCTGNTCRSPMAEFIFKFMAQKYGRGDEYEVSSAGLSADGGEISQNAKYALSVLGVPFNNKYSVQMSVNLAKESDLIICMTERHKSAFAGLKNCVTLSDLAFCGDIPDPYGQDRESYVKTAQVLYKAIESLFNIE